MTDNHIKLNRDYIGETYSSGPHSVDSDSIQQYALATNDTNPRYFQEDSHGRIVSPPLYPVVFIPMFRSLLADDAEKIGLDMLRVVHSQHRMKWKDLLYAGDIISITATIANMELHGIHDTMDLEIQVLRENDPIVEMIYQLLVRGKRKSREKRERINTQDLEMGKKLGEQLISISKDQGVRYAIASGDHNPIHIDEEIAKLASFSKTIVHGLCTMAISSKVIVDELLDGDPTRIRDMNARFSKPVLMEQTLTIELFDGGRKEGHSLVKYVTKNEEGIPVITQGIAEFIA